MHDIADCCLERWLTVLAEGIDRGVMVLSSTARGPLTTKRTMMKTTADSTIVSCVFGAVGATRTNAAAHKRAQWFAAYGACLLTFVDASPELGRAWIAAVHVLSRKGAVCHSQVGEGDVARAWANVWPVVAAAIIQCILHMSSSSCQHELHCAPLDHRFWLPRHRPILTRLACDLWLVQSLLRWY